MPYNASGTWIPEDDSVSGRVASIASSGSPLMRSAAGIGMGIANRRGLVNSSIGEGAATSSVLGAAVPIASQESQQTYGKNVQQMNNTAQANLTAAQIASSDRQALATQVGQAGGDYTTGLANTLTNDKIPAGTRSVAQQSILDTQNARIAALQRLYGVDLSWGNVTRPAYG